MKWKLIKCSLRTYYDLIRSDIPVPYSVKPSQPFEPSSAKSSQPSTLRPSQSSVMKPSREEIQALVEFLAKKKRSAKYKVPATPDSIHEA